MRLQLMSLVFWALLCLASSNRCVAQWTWDIKNDGTDIWLQSSLNRQSMFDYRLGTGGAIGEMRDNLNNNRSLLATSFAGESTDRIIQSTVWSQNIQNDIRKRGYQYYDRFNLTQGGTKSGRFSPTMQVLTNPQANRVDIYSVARDQWDSLQQPHMQSQFSTMTRYEMKDDGVLRIRRVMRVGEVTVDGRSEEFDRMYLEAWTPFRQKGVFNSMTRKIKSTGKPARNFSYRGNESFPTYPGWRVEETKGYAAVYKKKDPQSNRAAGIVFGQKQLEHAGFSGDNPNNDRYVLNSMAWRLGTDKGIAVLPGIEFDRIGMANPVTAGSIIDQSIEIVARHGLDAEFGELLRELSGELPAPILYSSDYAFTGELAGIVSQLNANLSLQGTRTDHLGAISQTVPARYQAVSARSQAVPEPSSMMALAMVTLLFANRRRRLEVRRGS